MEELEDDAAAAAECMEGVGASSSRGSPAFTFSSRRSSAASRLSARRLRISPRLGFDNPLVLNCEYGVGGVVGPVAYGEPLIRQGRSGCWAGISDSVLRRDRELETGFVEIVDPKRTSSSQCHIYKLTRHPATL